MGIMVALIFKKKAVVHVKENGPAVTTFQKNWLHGTRVKSHAKVRVLLSLRLRTKKNRYVHRNIPE